MAWTRSEKPQPPGTKFKVPRNRRAERQRRARSRLRGRPGQRRPAGPHGAADRRRRRARQSAVRASIPARTARSATCRGWSPHARSGTLPLLIVQGVVMTELAAAADIVLPGSAYVEKDAIYTNDQGRVQAASRAIAPPGEALEDWQILVNLAPSLGLTLRVRERRTTCGARWPPPCRARAYAEADRLCSRGRSRPATGCRRRTPRNAGSGTSCSRTCRR